MSNYITEIQINKVRHLENLSIKLGDEKKHLILTGKNGSGKTSVLEELHNLLLVEPLQLISFGEPTYTDIPNVSINHEYDNQEYFYAYFSAKQTSNGYSAIIDIVTELLLKIETTESKSFDVEGIVLIDEVETHLYVEMQKNIMPLLTSFFPNIQFIVTTHSPFVLQSIEKSVVYDLENQIQEKKNLNNI